MASILNIWGNQDLTKVAGCWSLNLCHSFTQHPSAATPQSLLRSSGWSLENWEEDKVDSLSVPNCWNKPSRHFQLFVNLMRKRVCPILRILSTLTSWQEEQEGASMSVKLCLDSWPEPPGSSRGVEKMTTSWSQPGLKLPLCRCRSQTTFPEGLKSSYRLTSVLCVFSISAVPTGLEIVLSTSVSPKCLQVLGQEWHRETFFRHLFSIFLVRRHFD